MENRPASISFNDADLWSAITSQEISRRTPLINVSGTLKDLDLGSREGTFRGDQTRKNPNRKRLRLSYWWRRRELFAALPIIPRAALFGSFPHDDFVRAVLLVVRQRRSLSALSACIQMGGGGAARRAEPDLRFVLRATSQVGSTARRRSRRTPEGASDKKKTVYPAYTLLQVPSRPRKR